jgi:predicted dehydrogenase
MKLTRRRLIQSACVSAAATFAAPTLSRAGSANDRIRVAIVGMGGRSTAHARSLIELEKEGGVEFAGICDCDKSNLDAAVQAWSQHSGHAIAGYNDMRRVLDDKSIDAVTFATPNHWHALNVIWGCQAGKDVYVEKPGSHTQCRSSQNIIEGIRKLHEGVIGDVYLGRGIAYKIRGNLGRHTPRPVPQGLDWNAWCGPAPRHEFSDFRHERWHWIWDYGNGEIGNQGVHQFDILRWGLKLDTLPETISSMGTNYMQQTVYASSAETPGVQTASLKWPDGKFVEFEVRDWYTNAEAGFRDQYPFVQKDFPVGAVFLGTEGTMIFPDYSSYRTFLGRKREAGPSAYTEGSPISDTAHFRNWIAACRSQRREDLSAEIVEGHRSAALCHLANIAYRLDRTVHFDSETETFPKDAEANALLTRPEREPYLVPQSV